MTPTSRYAKAKAEAKDTLESAVAAIPSASPEEVRKRCEELMETARMLAELVCDPWDPIDELAWGTQVNRLVRARRFALGLPVCAHKECPEKARAVFVGVATVRLCEAHEELELRRLKRINPELCWLEVIDG